MALIEINMHSAELDMTTQVAVIYPDILMKKEKFNVLFLLHGYSGAHLDWLRYTNIEKLANKYNLMVVMPSINNSYYTNMVYGYNYFNYYALELHNKISEMFRINLNKENTYIAGLSMGGYGALKAALTNPEKYKGAASFSGALNLVKRYPNPSASKRYDMMVGTFGDEETFNNNLHINDLFLLSDNLKENKVNLYISCGTEDFLYNDNVDFINHLKENKIEHKFIERPGDHNWDFWDEEIKATLEFFFGAKK